MNRHVLTLLALGLLVVWASESQACGVRRGCCAAVESCAPAPCVQPAPAPAPAPAPQFIERKVTRYKCVQKEKEIQEVVSRMVPRQENFTYTVMVPVCKEEVRKVTCYKPVQKQVETVVTVMVPVTVQEKRMVTECTMVQKEVESKVTVMVPKTVMQKKLVNYCEMERRVVEEVVPVCRVVREVCKDECGNCYTVCKRVVENQKCTREVCVPVQKTKEVECCVTVCEPQERVCKRIVCEPVRTQKEVTVCVTRCEAQQRKCTRTVCELVPETRDVVCKVTVCEAQQRTGTRCVYECKRETVTRKVICTEMVPEIVTERVPVDQCQTSCCEPAPRCGLFRGRCCN